MMTPDRKAAITAYKERKVSAGVYAVRCTSGEVWIGHWPDVDAIRTRIWFSLRHGANPNRRLQDAWTKHGEAAFTFEVLERLPGDTTPYLQSATLKERAAYWCSALGGFAI